MNQFTIMFMWGVKAFAAVLGFIVAGTVIICLCGLFANVIGSIIHIAKGDDDE